MRLLCDAENITQLMLHIVMTCIMSGWLFRPTKVFQMEFNIKSSGRPWQACRVSVNRLSTPSGGSADKQLA